MKRLPMAQPKLGGTSIRKVVYVAGTILGAGSRESQRNGIHPFWRPPYFDKHPAAQLGPSGILKSYPLNGGSNGNLAFEAILKTTHARCKGPNQTEPHLNFENMFRFFFILSRPNHLNYFWRKWRFPSTTAPKLKKEEERTQIRKPALEPPSVPPSAMARGEEQLGRQGIVPVEGAPTGAQAAHDAAGFQVVGRRPETRPTKTGGFLLGIPSKPEIVGPQNNTANMDCF